jgi:hypothetical protein
MQKVEGSSPFIRSSERSRQAGAFPRYGPRCNAGYLPFLEKPAHILGNDAALAWLVSGRAAARRRRCMLGA